MWDWGRSHHILESFITVTTTSAPLDPIHPDREAAGHGYSRDMSRVSE